MKDLHALASSFSDFGSAYLPTSVYTWRQAGVGECMECFQEDAKHVIVGFRISQIPEFSIAHDSRANEGYLECLLRQNAFIDTVYNVFLRSKDGLNSFVELRIENNPANKTINCYLLLRLIIKTSSAYYSEKRLVEEFRQLIPDDYVIEQIQKEKIAALLQLGKKHLIEVCKKTNILPVGSIYQPDTKEVAPSNLTDWDGKSRFYVPCSSYLEPKIYNLSNLYKILQNCNDQVQIRISLGAATLFDLEKNLSMQYHNMLHSTYRSVDNLELNGLLKSCTKYVTSNHLYSLKIQVASEREVAAMSIANSYCSQMGFGEMKAQTSLECFSLKDVPTNIKVIDWEQCNHHFYSYSLQNETLEGVDEAVGSFMQRLPYLCDASEAVGVFRLPVATVAGIPGMFAKPIKPFYQPNPRSQKEREIQIGKIITSPVSGASHESSALSYSLPVADLTKHGLIVGSTGSGKTNTTLNFVKELAEKGIPFLLIEPVKSEYYGELLPYFGAGKLNRFNFKRPYLSDGSLNPAYLRFNPLVPIEGISSVQHISYIKGCFNAAFPMHGIMPMVLEECLYRLYTGVSGGDERRLFDGALSPKYFHHMDRTQMDEAARDTVDMLTIPTLKDVIDVYLDNAELFSEEERRDFGSYLKRRVEKLTKGVLGNAFCPELWVDENNSSVGITDNIAKMLTEPTVVELEDLADNDEKALVMAFIMTYLFEYRQTRPSLKTIELEDREDFDISKHIHITIIEEAHRLLSSSNVGSGGGGGEDGIVTQDSKAKSISLFIDMLAEIRAKGEGIFVVEQIPTKLVSDVIKNTNLKIMHRITSKDDRHYLGEAMNMTEQQKNYVNKLKTGEAIIFEEQLDNPVFVKMNRFI